MVMLVNGHTQFMKLASDNMKGFCQFFSYSLWLKGAQLVTPPPCNRMCLFWNGLYSFVLPFPRCSKCSMMHRWVEVKMEKLGKSCLIWDCDFTVPWQLTQLHGFRHRWFQTMWQGCDVSELMIIMIIMIIIWTCSL